MLKKISAFVASCGLAATNAFAAVPTEVTTAITEAGTDAKTVAGAVLVVVVGLLAFRYMRREAK